MSLLLSGIAFKISQESDHVLVLSRHRLEAVFATLHVDTRLVAGRTVLTLRSLSVASHFAYPAAHTCPGNFSGPGSTGRRFVVPASLEPGNGDLERMARS